MGSIQNENSPMNSFLSPDMTAQVTSAAKLGTKPIRNVTFTVIITYTHVCMRVHECGRENWVYYLLSALYVRMHMLQFVCTFHIYTLGRVELGQTIRI